LTMNIESLAEMAKNRINQDNALSSMRQEFLSQFKEKGFKETVQDSYKFTHLASLFSHLKLNHEKLNNSEERECSFPTIRLINGELEGTDKLPEGIKVGKISERGHEMKSRFQHA